MHIAERRQRAIAGNTLRNMRITHRSTCTINEGHRIGFLLAHPYQRHRRYSQNLQSVPKYITASNKAFGKNTAHITIMAITGMGNRPLRPSATFVRGNKFVVVAIEYFTRWIEAKPLENTTSESVKNSSGRTLFADSECLEPSL